MYVVVTDYGEGDDTDFILSPRAFGRMALVDKSEELYTFGVVDVEFLRVPCRFRGYKVNFKVHENSKYPQYLAVSMLYVGGQNDVQAVEIWQVITYKLTSKQLIFSPSIACNAFVGAGGLSRMGRQY